MRVLAASAVLLLLSGCSESDFNAEKRRFHFMQRNGASSGELCAQAKKVAAAAVDENDRYEYVMWATESGFHCPEGQS